MLSETKTLVAVNPCRPQETSDEHPPETVPPVRGAEDPVPDGDPPRGVHRPAGRPGIARARQVLREIGHRERRRSDLAGRRPRDGAGPTEWRAGMPRRE